MGLDGLSVVGNERSILFNILKSDLWTYLRILEVKIERLGEKFNRLKYPEEKVLLVV